jgi:Ras-related protein Rab-23
MLWDTAGQEEFDAITKAYYRGAQAAVLAFSTVDRVSFDAIRSWKKKVGTTFGLFFIRVEMMSWAGK